ncbi:sorting nexin-16 [Nematostella vectensis]|uniref:sorting nexin-16 n=1 Tax=Nematostella vectensis TaxID=45351 RepID=UPI002076EDC2|nr:sorting nexin-16 [Nematostella vectensis]
MADDNTNSEDSNNEHFESLSEQEIQAPIVGYEVVESRKRFTVFQIAVNFADGRSWFVFRRYSEFARMDENLRKMFTESFPDCSLPPKRFLGDNFENCFIEMRKNALQEYLNCILSRDDISGSQPVVEFLCLDEPPGPYDSLEESRAFIDNLEESLSELRARQSDLRGELKLAKAQLRQAQGQRRALLVALRSERVLNGKPSHDGDDVALISEYSGLPEVKSLIDSSKFGKDEEFRGRTWRYRLSGNGSQWDLSVQSTDGYHHRSTSRPNSLCGSMRASSTPDVVKAVNISQRRRGKHLPSDEKGKVSILDKFMRQSTDALHQIRQSVRQKLGNWESEGNT